MPIRLKPRAAVSSDFVELYKQLAEVKLRFQMNKIAAMSKSQAKASMVKSASMYGRLTDIVRGVEEPGRGLDFELSRLHALDFQELFVHQHRDQKYFAARTRDVVIDEINSKGKLTGQWDGGVFTVYIPYKGIIGSASDGIHVIPERNPMTYKRHFHHTSTGDVKHYLDMHPHTCWSEFATPIVAAINEVNMVELFRFMRTFVGRYYSGSPLANPQWNANEMRHLIKL